jgi:hypothetical protein
MKGEQNIGEVRSKSFHIISEPLRLAALSQRSLEKGPKRRIEEMLSRLLPCIESEGEGV